MGLIREIDEQDFFGVEWFSPAKINFFLRILKKRSDGYHQLESFMVPLSFGDCLKVFREKNPSLENKNLPISLKVLNEDLPEDANNLVFRAARAFRKMAQTHNGKTFPSLKINLEKKIPIGAGLGGGSSNAASILMALNHLFGKPLSSEDLHQLACPLGADVPFFLLEKSAFAEGVGEILTPVTLREKLWFVLIFPNFSVSTKWVYENLDLNLTSKALNGTMSAPNELANPENLNKLLRNDLEGVTLEKYPKLGEIKEKILSFGAEGALMSGSGPTLFGYFLGDSAEEKAQKAFRALREQKSWKVFLAHNLE